jgi:hypothetical protein
MMQTPHIHVQKDKKKLYHGLTPYRMLLSSICVFEVLTEQLQPHEADVGLQAIE